MSEICNQQKKLKRLQKELEDMENIEKIVNALSDEGTRPFYEEDMELNWWRKKNLIREQIKELQRKKK